MSSYSTEEVKDQGDALNAIDRDYAGDLSQTVAKKALLMRKLLPDVFAPISTVITRFAAAGCIRLP